MKDKEFGSPLSNPNLPVYIGIDQSYSGFGITALQGDDFISRVHKFEGGGVSRLIQIWEWTLGTMDDMLKSVNQTPEDVAIEGYAYGSQMANMAGELGATIKLALSKKNIYPLIVPPTMVKKYACGKGQGVQKNRILLEVYKKWGVEFTDDNAADSYILARIAQGSGTLVYEQEILTKLKDPKYREK